MACLRAVQPRATSVAATKTRVPSIVHPLSSSGYLIIIQFILSCVVNVLIFSLAYSFLVLAFPISLLYKIGQKCVVCIRVLSQGGGKADVGNSSEKFWFVSTDETRFPSLFLLLIVKGELGIELVKFLIHNRLSYCKGEVGKTHLSRLARTPRLIFHELMWFETNLDDNPIKEVNPKRIHLFEFKKRKFTIENPTSDVDWQVYHYSNEEGLANNNIIFFGFHHSYADLYTFVYFLSGNFLDKTAFAFRNEVSSTQAFCLSCIALLAGPSIFVKSLLKANNAIFLEPTGKKERAIFFSEPVSRLLVETITTATGASVSDVVLSCLAGSLRACLRQNGVAFPSDVTVYLPMNLQSSRSLTCFTSFNILSLPVGTEGAIPRLWEMQLRRSHISSLVQAITMSTVIQLAFLILPNSLAKQLIERLMTKCSMSVTCILGQTLDEELLLDGRTVESFVPVEDNGYEINITIIEYEEKFQLAVLGPGAEDWVIKPSELCAGFTQKLNELSTHLTERARVIRARGQKLLNSRKNGILILEEEK